MRMPAGILVLSACVCAQDLLINGDFEAALTGWSSWSRAAGAISAQATASPVHGGSGAVHIVHQGTQDWALQQQSTLSVKTGSYYEYSAWVKRNSAKGEAQISVVLYTAGDTALDWSYGAREFSDTSATWVRYIARFVAPDRAAKMRARIIGSDTCDIVVDDAALYLRDTLAAGQARVYALDNGTIAGLIAVPSFALTVKDKASGHQVTTAGKYDFRVMGVDSNAGVFTFHCVYLPDSIRLDMRCRLQSHELEVTLAGDSTAAMAQELAFPGVIPADTADYLIIPRATGMLWPANARYPLWNYTMWAWKSTMSFVGVTNLSSGRGYLLISQEPWDTRADFSVPAGPAGSAPQLVHVPQKHIFGKPRTFTLAVTGSGGYVGLCQIYRESAARRGLVRTFTDKISANANVEKLMGAVDFWIMDWNMLRNNALDTLRRFGIDRAIISFWANDTAATKRINAAGYLSSRYDIYTDVWPPNQFPTEGYRREGYPQDIIVKESGGLQEGWLAYVNGTTPFQGYVACSATHPAYAGTHTRAELDTNPFNCRFVDVETAASLYECFSTVHPVNRYEDAQWRCRLLDRIKNEYRLVTGSEEARDFTFPSDDFGEGAMTMQPVANAGYDWQTPVDAPDSDFVKYNDPALRVPLHGLVYHDVHVPTWYTGDGMSKTPTWWDVKELMNCMYGSMPLFMPPDKAYWDQHLTRFLVTYHTACALFRATGKSRMTSNQFLSADRLSQKTAFANGWQVIANFSATARTIDGRAMAPHGLYASDGTWEVARTGSTGAMNTLSYTPGKLFVAADTGETEYRGLRSRGAAYCEKSDTALQLAFCGAQASVAFNPDLLPWRLSNPAVRIDGKNTLVTPTALAGGWLRIDKSGSDRFYRITGAFAQAEPAVGPPRRESIRISRFRNGIAVHLPASAKPWSRVQLISPDGRIAAQAQGDCRFSGIRPGIYAIRIMSSAGNISTIKPAAILQ